MTTYLKPTLPWRVVWFPRSVPWKTHLVQGGYTLCGIRALASRIEVLYRLLLPPKTEDRRGRTVYRVECHRCRYARQQKGR